MSLIKIRRIATLDGEDKRDGKDSIASDDAEEIAHDSEIVALWQVLGDAKAYLREGKKNHNVKNVLAAAIKAAEKEDPNDRSVAEAKKVLAQFDAAELRVVHAKGIGKWWVEPNLSRFNDTDREQTHKGRKEFPDREAAMKYARGTGKTFIVNDACEDAAEFHVGQRVRAKDPRWTGYQGHALVKQKRL